MTRCVPPISVHRRARALALFFLVAASLLAAPALAEDEGKDPGLEHRHLVEVFPIVAFFRIYSVQYSYRLLPWLDAVTGFTYVGANVEDQQGNQVGRYSAPTVPVGLRAYFWRNAHVEYQLWPAWNTYHERATGRSHAGFDLYSEIRVGYRLDFQLWGLPLFTNLQYVVGFGLYPGNKPESFFEAVEGAPLFHVPSASIGIRL